eukprot:SAG31_NODE_19080_length_612_cov_1.697856_1_plen_154_part_10
MQHLEAALAADEECLAKCELPGGDAVPQSVAGFFRAGAIKVMLKGGNSINMLKHTALQLLPAAAQTLLADVRPSSLSDVDFLLLINSKAPGCGWLADASNFDAVHQRCRAAAEKALDNFTQDLVSRLERGDKTVANFDEFFRRAREHPAAVSAG